MGRNILPGGLAGSLLAGSLLAGSLLASSLLASVATASDAKFRVLHAEPIAATASQLTSATDQPSLQFQAYGRQFALNLRSNARLLAHLPAAQKATLQRFPIYKGELAGIPGSWVRVTRIGDALQGAFWDGTHLYTITTARDVEPFVLQSLGASGDDLVVYRLSDTESVLDTAFCATGAAHEVAGKAHAGDATAYQKLVAELRAQAVGAAVATEQIEIAFVADFELSQRFGSDTQATMMTRINVLDGIFDGQVGVTIVPFFQIFTDANDPFTASNASTLLNELSTYRRNTPNIRSRGLAHLMTGRALDGNTAGVAFIGALCSVGSGAGLSEGRGSNTAASLIAAHEIGHNFGAPHDAEAGSACTNTPGTFLMNPQINGSSIFSQCSLDQIRPVVDSASCVTPVATADVALGALTGTLSAEANTNFNVVIDVNSVGNAQVNGVTLTATPSSTLSVSSAAATSGTCTVGANSVVNCNLGSMASASTRRVTLVARGASAGAAQVAVDLAATNDASAANNSGTQAVSISAATSQPPPSSSGGGGGGGALSTWMILVLLALLALRFARTARP